MDSQFNNVNTTLEPNQKWAGKYDVVIGYVTIIIHIQSDQNCTINIKQSDNRANFDFFESISYVPDVRGYARYQVYVNSAYALIEVVNTSDVISNLIVHTHFAAIGKDGSILEPQIVTGSVSVSNLPETQQVSGNVTVDSITAPLPAGTNTIGTVKLVGNCSGFGPLNPTTFFNGSGGSVGENAVALVTTMDAIVGNASVAICAVDSQDTGSVEYLSCSVTGSGNFGPIRALHTYVDNFPETQQVNGNVTVDSITAPLPAGTNKMGTVGISGLWNDGFSTDEVQATMFKFPNPFGGDGNAVSMVTTMDALYGKASVNVWATDDRYNLIGSGEPSSLTSRYIPSTQSPPYINSINSLHTWVDNFPENQTVNGSVTIPHLSSSTDSVNVGNFPTTQLVAGHETDYMFYSTPTTNVPAVYADGIQGANVTGGWSYTSTLVGTPPYTGSRNKINWYLYGSTDASTDYTVSQLINVYAVINQKSTLGNQAQLPFITIYTRPDSGTNVGGWYKNKLTYVAENFTGTMGMMLLYTGDDPVGVHPEITGASRMRLAYNSMSSTTTVSAAQGESVWLGTLQTASEAKPDGTRNFVFSEFSMMWDKSPIVIPISQNQVQVFDKALNASATTLVNNFAGITITSNKLQVGGSVSVSNLPTTQEVSGSVSVSNLPATQPVSGSVSVSNLPTTQAVSGTFWQTTQPVSGTFWQTTQPVSGTVAISNFPEGGSNVTVVSALPAGTNAIGSVTVSNFPAGGSEVSVSNFPATQAVSGTVAISNFPAGGSEVSVVSALPTGTNVIGAVNENIRNYSVTFSPQYEPQYQDSIGQAFNMTNYKSVDLIVKPNYASQSNEDQGITLVVEISIDGNDWAPLANYSLNFKGLYPKNQAINNIQTNALYIRLSALTANNPTPMGLVCQVTWISKY
jgi:hypothetical protein